MHCYNCGIELEPEEIHGTIVGPEHEIDDGNERVLKTKYACSDDCLQQIQ